MELTDKETAELWDDDPAIGDPIGRFTLKASVRDWNTSRWMTYTLAVLEDAEGKLWGCTRGYGLTEYQEHEEPDSDLFPVKAVPAVAYVAIKKHT